MEREKQAYFFKNENRIKVQRNEGIQRKERKIQQMCW